MYIAISVVILLFFCILMLFHAFSCFFNTFSYITVSSWYEFTQIIFRHSKLHCMLLLIAIAHCCFIQGVDNCKCHVPITSVFDLEDVHSVCREVTHCWNVCQCIDIVICNAGMSFRGCIQETCLDVDRQLMAVNYFGHVALVKGMFLC